MTDRENKLAQINRRRKQCQSRVVIGGILLVLAGLTWIVSGNTQILAILIGIPGLVLVGIGAGKFAQLRNEFKLTYLKGMIEEIFTNAEYHPQGGLDINRVYQCNFLKRADRFHMEDLIRGAFEDVTFETCDLRLEERHVRHTKHGTQVYYVTYFLGRFFEFAFPKEFKGQVITMEGGMFTLFSQLKKVQLESVVYNKKFKTYASEELSAFYILTPHLMESIMELEQTHPGTISISFFGNRMNLAIHNSKNTFELNLFKEVNEATFDALRNDLKMIKDIVLELKLNRNIFK